MAKYDPTDRAQYERALAYFTRLCQAGERFELRKISSEASTSQVAYLHVILRLYALELGLMDDEAKMYFKQLNREIFVDEEKREFRSVTDLDTAQLTTAIEKFRNHALNDAGIYIPEPHEEQKMFALKAHLERSESMQY